MENKQAYALLKTLQQNETDGAVLYQNIASMTKDEKDRATLYAISADEVRHAQIFAKYTGAALQPRRMRIFFYMLLSRLFGYTFAIKLLEITEDKIIHSYKQEVLGIPELNEILHEEEIHEQQLLEMLDEERLNYVGDMVLGMNDALVELTGALAGYTLAMQNTHYIAMAGLITGVSATLSMSASGYLSSREEGQRNAVKSSIYTGVAYLFTVVMLIFPYLILPVDGYMVALAITLVTAIIIIAGYNFYVSIAKSRPFGRNFLVMVAISMGVAIISFGVGILVKNALGIDL